MKSTVLLAIGLAILLYGCTSAQEFDSGKFDSVMQSNLVDFDGDGNYNYGVYTYAESTIARIKLRRMVFFNSEQQPTATSTKTLTNADLQQLEHHLNNFILDYEDKTAECSKNLGIRTFTCADPETCVTLCSAGSVSCKAAAEKQKELLGESILRYVNENNEINEIISDIERDYSRLEDREGERKAQLIENIIKITDRISAIEANPVMAHSDVKLCEKPEYQLRELYNATDILGEYDREEPVYSYFVIIEIAPGGLEKKGPFDEINLADIVPPNSQIKAVSKSAAVVRNQAITVSGIRSDAGKITVFYSVVSETEPETIKTQFRTPSGTIKSVDTTVILPMVMVFDSLKDVSKNVYIALSGTTAIMVVGVLLILTILNVLLNSIIAIASKEPISAGITRALGRINVRWKSDLAAAIVSVVIGIGIMSSTAPKIDSATTLFRGIELVFSDPLVAIPSVSLFFGFVLIYLAVENRVKIVLLEHYYGKQLREEKDRIYDNAKQLRTRLNDLRMLVENLSKEEFDVGQEYDILGSISLENIAALEKKADSTAAKIIEDQLTNVEEAIERLQERKHTAEQNWTKWKDAIYQMLEKSGEVHPSSLLAVPSSLRTWAIQKFAKEYGAGAVIEGEVLKKREIKPESAAKSFVDSGLLGAAVIIKTGKIYSANISTGNRGVVSVLSLKLLTYLKSAAKELGQHDFTTLAVIGKTNVIGVIRQTNADSILIMEKGKFKEAVEEWKGKMKNF